MIGIERERHDRAIRAHRRVTTVAAHVRRELTDDRVPLVAAGVAYYAFVALVPAIFVLLSVYGFVADPVDVRHLARTTLAAAPPEVRHLVVAQVDARLHTTALAVSTRAVLAGGVALWAASGALAHLVEAVCVAGDTRPRAHGLRLRLVAVAASLAVALVVALAVGVVTVVPHLASGPARSAVEWLRWPVLFGLLLGACALLYRLAPAQRDPDRRALTVGAFVASAGFVGASILLSVYSSNFARFHTTYGSLSTTVVTLLWLYLGAFAVVLGAEVDTELAARRRRGVWPPRAPGNAPEAVEMEVMR